MERGGALEVGLGGCDVGCRMRLLRDNLVKGREYRSEDCSDSDRKETTAGAGDDGRLEGRKKEEDLRTFILKKDF